MVLVTYDVATGDRAGQKRLHRIAKICENHGLRAQKSVFECAVDSSQWQILKNKLLQTYKEDSDSLRFYYLGSNWDRKVEHYGVKETPNVEKDLLMV